MGMKNILAGLLPFAAMGLTNNREDFDFKDFDFIGRRSVRVRKSKLSNKEWTKRKKRISNEKRARAKNRN